MLKYYQRNRKWSDLSVSCLCVLAVTTPCTVVALAVCVCVCVPSWSAPPQPEALLNLYLWHECLQTLELCCNALLYTNTHSSYGNSPLLPAVDPAPTMLCAWQFFIQNINVLDSTQLFHFYGPGVQNSTQQLPLRFSSKQVFEICVFLMSKFVCRHAPSSALSADDNIMKL